MTSQTLQVRPQKVFGPAPWQSLPRRRGRPQVLRREVLQASQHMFGWAKLTMMMHILSPHFVVEQEVQIPQRARG